MLVLLQFLQMADQLKVTDKEVKKLVTEQNEHLDLIKKLFFNTRKKRENNSSIGYMKERIETAKIFFQRAATLHADIISAVEDEVFLELKYSKSKTWDETKEEFESAELYFIDKLNELHTVLETSQLQQATSSPRTRNAPSPFFSSVSYNLFRIKIPIFSGDRSTWIHFRDLFVSMIGSNPDYDKVKKLNYLKCSLAGVASNLVGGLRPEEVNYDSAMQTLTDRYENKRLIISELLYKLFSAPDVTLDGLSKLRELHQYSLINPWLFE